MTEKFEQVTDAHIGHATLSTAKMCGSGQKVQLLISDRRGCLDAQRKSSEDITDEQEPPSTDRDHSMLKAIIYGDVQYLIYDVRDDSVFQSVANRFPKDLPVWTRCRRRNRCGPFPECCMGMQLLSLVLTGVYSILRPSVI